MPVPAGPAAGLGRVDTPSATGYFTADLPPESRTPRSGEPRTRRYTTDRSDPA